MNTPTGWHGFTPEWARPELPCPIGFPRPECTENLNELVVMNVIPRSDYSRRQFLAQAGLGLAAVSTLNRAIAQGSAANSRLRLGVVGCGSRGQWIAGLFREHG